VERDEVVARAAVGVLSVGASTPSEVQCAQKYHACSCSTLNQCHFDIYSHCRHLNIFLTLSLSFLTFTRILTISCFYVSFDCLLALSIGPATHTLAPAHVRTHATQNGFGAVWEGFLSMLDATGESRSFKVIELPSDATLPEVRKRCRALKLEFHPDKNIGDGQEKAQVPTQESLRE
jgi:hypothetical protein